VPGVMMVQTEAPAIDDEVYVSWSDDSATVLPS